MAEYKPLEGLAVSNYLDMPISVTVDTDLVGLGQNYEVSLATYVSPREHTQVFFQTKEDFKKFVENLQTIVSEIEDEKNVNPV